MKKYLALSVVLLSTISGYGSQTHAGNPSQFTVPKATKLARARLKARLAANAKGPVASAKAANSQRQSQRNGKAQTAHANVQSSSSPTSLGFVSAIQIPAGGDDDQQGWMGDFNGDGKKDVVNVVQKNVNSTYFNYISVVLGNGNGTFQPAFLTQVVNDDPLLIGDVNGDGKDDIIQVHPDNEAPSTADVWLSNGDGTFTQGNTYQISPAELNGGLLTDVNGDGKLDMMAIDAQTPGQVRTLLGNGDGTFQQATAATLAAEAPGDLVFADFNGDGKPDFAGTGTNDQIVIYLQEGGNFIQTGAPLSVSDSVYDYCGIAAGDLTGDGAAEVITMNCGSTPDQNTITIYMNNGSGTFATGVYVNEVAAGGSTPSNALSVSATIADVNGDGKADILLGNVYGGDISVLLGNGDGTVKVPTFAYATGGYPFAVPLVADFNGDGLPDIMESDNNYSFAYLQGYGDGTFRAALDYYGPINDSSWPESYAIATGDFNGDGVPDFAVGNCCSETAGVTVYLSRGDGSLRPGVNYGTGVDMDGIAVGDFNGDGKLDIAATSFVGSTVQIFNGNGDGTFSVGANYASGGGSCGADGIVVGDFNHDQHPDLAIANQNCDVNTSNVGVLLNDGSGNFNTPVTYPIGYDMFELAAGDVTGDGYADLLVPTDDLYYVAVLVNNGNGTFGTPSYEYLANGSAIYYDPTFITLGDFNGDGKLDFAVSAEYFPEEGLVVALGNGDGTFQTPNLYSVTSQDYYFFDDPYPTSVQTADFNGDGILDLVYTNYDYGTVGVLLGNGDGSFGLPNEYPAGGQASALAIADVNGDGALDVVTANDNADNVTVMLNANGTAEKPDFAVTTSANSATAKAGSAATYDLSVTGKNGYGSAITFTCSGLPAKATCAFSPASVTAAGNDPQATVLTISTTAAKTITSSVVPPVLPRSNSRSSEGALLASLSGIGLFGLVVAAEAKKRNRRLMVVMLGILLLAVTFSSVGCGSSSHSQTITTTVAGTPAGTYTVKVTAAGTGSGAPTHTMNLTLVVE